MNTNIVGCECSGQTKNTGFLGQQLFGVPQGIYVVPRLAADGTRNHLDLTLSNLGAELLAKVNHADPTKRFYPIHQLVEFAPDNEEMQFTTTNNGLDHFLRDGIKKDTFELWDMSPQFLAKIKQFCFDFGIYKYDNCGNLMGMKDSATDTKLYPLGIYQPSWGADDLAKTATENGKIMVRFQYLACCGSEKKWLIPESAFGANHPSRLAGLVDVLVTAVAATDTTLTVNVKGTFGNALGLLPIQGLVAANTTVFNQTDNAAVTVSTLVESTTVPGQYVLTMAAAQTTADLLKVSVFKAATGAMLQGYEGSVSGVPAL